jgi:hypothetical protein
MLSLPTTILDELPPELIWRIDKFLHREFQLPINKEIKRTVEKIEDAKEMDNLYYVHLHHIRNCTRLPFLLPGSFKRITYKWIYETPEDCIEYDEEGTLERVCEKHKIYSSRDVMYLDDGDKYTSEPIYTGMIARAYKMRKLDC